MNLTEVVCSAGEYNKGLVRHLLGPYLLPFTEALVKDLQEPNGPRSDVGLKTVIIKALTVSRDVHIILKTSTRLPRIPFQYIPLPLVFVSVFDFVQWPMAGSGEARAEAAVAVAAADPAHRVEHADAVGARLRRHRRQRDRGARGAGRLGRSASIFVFFISRFFL